MRILPPHLRIELAHFYVSAEHARLLKVQRLEFQWRVFDSEVAYEKLCKYIPHMYCLRLSHRPHLAFISNYATKSEITLVNWRKRVRRNIRITLAVGLHVIDPEHYPCLVAGHVLRSNGCALCQPFRSDITFLSLI